MHDREGEKALDSRDIRDVVVLCLAGIGDTLLFTPVLADLKRAFPGIRVTAVTMLPGPRSVMQSSPYVDELLHFDFPHEGVLRSLRFVLRLRRRKFDAMILAYPSNRPEYNVVAFLIGGKIRVGHRYNHLDLLCANWLKNKTVREDDALSNIEENLRLAELLTGEKPADNRVELSLTDEHNAFASRWLAEREFQNAYLVGFHPGCDTRKNHINRRWPPAYFAELGKVLYKERGARILVFGGPEEDPLKQRVAEAIGCGAIAVRTEDIFQSCALIKACNYFVTNDSALMHIAGVLGVPTSAIYGPTNPVWLRNPHAAPRDEITLQLECSPCFYYSPRHLRCRYGDFRCVRELTPEQVAARVLRCLPPSSDRLAANDQPEASAHE